MTRTFNEKIRCPQCGYEHTAETDLERWIRNHPQLQSNLGLVRFDLDILLHKYMTHEDGKGVRDLQSMMFVEVKTFMGNCSPAQADTLGILDQGLRNRKPNINSTPRPQMRGDKAWSKMANKYVTLKMLGGHKLQLDGTDPNNSSLIMWDNDPISTQELIELLLFVRDPDRPHIKMDHRRRSRKWKEQVRLFN